MEELAIFGGKPVRENKIFYGRQYIDQADVDAVAAVMTSDYITCGPKVKELEQHLCELTHAKYAVVVCNGTAALHLAALAAGFGEGDEVIVSSITFAASSNCVLYAGAKPVFADIDPETYNIDPASIRKLITPRTKAIVAVDFTGQAVELDEIREICKEHDLILIEYFLLCKSNQLWKRNQIYHITLIHPVHQVMKLVSLNCDWCCCHQDSSRSVSIFFYCFFHCRFHAHNRQWKLTSVFFCGHTRSCIAGNHNRIYLLLYHKCYNFVNISPDLLSCFFPIWDVLLVRIIEKICFW